MLVSIIVSVPHPVWIVPHTMGGPKVAVFEGPPGLVTSLRWFQALDL